MHNRHCSTFGLKIPHWGDILKIAVECADMVGLGYLGVDLVMDSKLGPLMLELNARPGLNVQIANQMGLEGAIRALKAQQSLPTSVAERIQLATKQAAVS